ncbi:MAG TPA: SHOCT domain-containing protein [Ignavibacteriaceae bacterium]|nr:SHOCT domain-containing protein [Ignavibacteriaceae bacterium]
MFHDGFMGGMWYGWIFWLLILIVIGWVIVNQMNKNKRDTQLPQQDSAINILKKRYAQGEISKEEFERMKKDLT